MKDKGFTLVELIAVIVIMGMILLIVFPGVSRLMTDNEDEEYSTYYEIVKKGVEKYAQTRRDDIGGISGNGCIDIDDEYEESDGYNLELSDLIERDYIKKFEGEKNVVCRTPNEISTSELTALGIDTSKEYVSIRIENNKGKITTEVSMICNKVGKNKVEYEKLIEKTRNCDRYVADIDSSLIKEITSKITATPDGTGESFVSGTATNNYVWYSGKMWRIISYKPAEKTIKMIMDENASVVTYDMNSNNYRTSNIRNWLNNNFVNTLRSPDRYLTDVDWDYTTTTTTVKPNGSSKVSAKVGLINYYEYSKVQGFLNIGKNYWLLSDYSGSNVWYVTNSNTPSNSEVNKFLGVRPTVVLRPNITYIVGGDGTSSNPYRLTGDTSASVGTSLNTRFAGEYVKINDILFRIIETNKDNTKLIADQTINGSNTQFHFYNKVYSSDTYIGTYLTTWIDSFKDKLTTSDFCRMTINTTIPQTLACQSSDIVALNVGIPKVGDLFTANSNLEYWTLSNSTDGSLNVIEPDGTIKSKEITEYSYIRPVISVKGNAIIQGGNGTSSSPYTIQ